MKTIQTLCLVLILCSVITSHAQFLENLGKSAQKAAERTVNRRIENETQKKTDQALDTIFETGKGGKSQKEGKAGQSKPAVEDEVAVMEPQSRKEITVNSNFDFEPGNVVIFEDNFKRDNPGDFPAKWDTNGSGEMVTVNGEKWFNIAVDAKTFPHISQPLPNNYTIEFDLLTEHLTKDNTNVSSSLYLYLESAPKFESGSSYMHTNISFLQYGGESWTNVIKYANGREEIKNSIRKDYKDEINGKSRISISVNGPRLRMWVNEEKIVDVPRLVPDGNLYFKMEPRFLNSNKKNNRIFIRNFRIAKTGKDNRSKLLSEGILSTNAILFKTASSTISGGGEDILKEVGEVMQSVPDIKILIVGHTDSDGGTEANLKLSQDRAEAVKMALVTQYDIKFSRIQTQGKGESDPIANNALEMGRSQNRRVEFIKL